MNQVCRPQLPQLPDAALAAAVFKPATSCLPKNVPTKDSPPNPKPAYVRFITVSGSILAWHLTFCLPLVLLELTRLPTACKAAACDVLRTPHVLTTDDFVLLAGR
jgi:hypothetical protein